MLQRRLLQYFLIFLIFTTMSMLVTVMRTFRHKRNSFTQLGVTGNTVEPLHRGVVPEQEHVSCIGEPKEKSELLKPTVNRVHNDGKTNEVLPNVILNEKSIANVRTELAQTRTTRKPVKPRPVQIKRHNRPVFSSLPAVWPKPVAWPETWVRPTAYKLSRTAKPRDSDLRVEPIICDMKSLVNTLRPRLPPHFQLRRFRTLPRRYADIAEPRPSPFCGILGLVYPWKLIKQQAEESGKSKQLWMLFVIKSAPGYEINRMLVRKTWAASDHFSKRRMFVLFVVGKTNDKNVTENVRIENEKYGDILQCDFVDHYNMLPIKILSTFRWVLERNLDVNFITMTDDDCLVNLPNLTRYFDANVTVDPDYHKKVYCGSRYHADAIPSRSTNKWSVTIRQYSGRIYPTFCHGGLWTLAKPLMHGIYCVSEITKIGDFFLEDVLLTGILREKLNLKDTNIVKIVDFVPRSAEGPMFFHGGFQKNAAVAQDAVRKQWQKWQHDWNATEHRNNTR